jgi:hypothetical protein
MDTERPGGARMNRHIGLWVGFLFGVLLYALGVWGSPNVTPRFVTCPQDGNTMYFTGRIQDHRCQYKHVRMHYDADGHLREDIHESWQPCVVEDK